MRGSETAGPGLRFPRQRACPDLCEPALFFLSWRRRRARPHPAAAFAACGQGDLGDLLKDADGAEDPAAKAEEEAAAKDLEDVSVGQPPARPAAPQRRRERADQEKETSGPPAVTNNI